MILDKLSNLTVRERICMAIMVVVVSVFLVDWLVVRRVVRRLGDLSTMTQIAERTRRFNYGMLGIKAKVTGQYEKARGELELPLSDEEIIAETQNRTLFPLLQKHHIQIEGTKDLPSSLPPVGAAREYVVEMDGVDGEMVDLMEFMDELNHLQGLYRVSKVHLVPGETPYRGKGTIAVARLVLRSPTSESETPAATAATH